MLIPDEVLLFIVGLFDDLNIPYMIVGSYASNYYGHPRATNDADLFVMWQPKEIDGFAARLGSDFYADAEDLKDGIREQRMSNIIHLASGFKVDLSPLAPTAFYRQAFDRRRPGKLLGRKIYFASPEDVILMKLLWAKQSESGRQIEDAQGIFQVQKKALDKGYLTRWAQNLGILEFVNKLDK